MRKIQILGTGCPKCKTLMANAEAAVKALGIEAQFEKIDKIGDIGRKFTDDVEDYYDYHNDTDVTSDSLYDLSNQIQKTTYSKDQDIQNFPGDGHKQGNARALWRPRECTRIRGISNRPCRP